MAEPKDIDPLGEACPFRLVLVGDIPSYAAIEWEWGNAKHATYNPIMGINLVPEDEDEPLTLTVRVTDLAPERSDA